VSEDEARITINSSADIVTARGLGREMAINIGFSVVDQTKITTAISELARNIVTYAGKGRVTIKKIRRDEDGKQGIEVKCTDKGPGIENVELALKGGYSTSGSLGLGLSGAKKLMDEFEIKSKPGKGTTVVIRKWVR
jgi:serine/threonine-protein kinase RsbT